MKTANVFNKRISFKNKDYANLLKRFDIKNFEGGRHYMDCPLCVTYGHKYDGCVACPLQKVYDQDYGCLNLADNVLKYKRRKDFLTFRTDSVEYYGKTGRSYIKIIHKFLMENFK